MSEISQAINQAQQNRVFLAKNIKIIVLAIASFLLIAATWLLTKNALFDNTALINWVWVIAASIFWVASICFLVLVNPYRWLFALVNVWSLAVYLVLFPKNLYVALGGVLFFLLSLLFQQRIKSEEINHLHFSIRRTVSSSIVIITYAFLLLIGFNIYHTTDQDFKNNPQTFYDRIGDATAKSIPFLTKNFGPGTDLNQTLDQYLNNKIDQEYEQPLPESWRAQFMEQYRQQFLKQFGIDAQGGETLAAIISKVVNERSKFVFERYGKFFPLIFTLFIFALLRTFAFIFHWLTIFTTWALFRLLFWVKFFKISKALVQVDRLDI